MKNTYTAPQLTVHGNVEEITQAFGKSMTRDVAYVGNSTVEGDAEGIVGHGTGSIDGVIVPLEN